jgi:hypothetical protein
MWYPDLLLTKAVALRRQEAQRTGADPYAPPAAMHVYRGEHRTVQVHRLQAYLGGRLVTWGRRLQRLGEPQTLLR